MSENKKLSSILEAPSLDDDPDHKAQLAKKQGITTANTLPKRVFDALAGGVRPGETSVQTRRRGAGRAAGALAATAALVIAPHAVETGKNFSEHAADLLHQHNVQPLLDYQQGKELEEGIVVLKAGNFQGTATEWVKDHAADLSDNNKTQDLLGRVQAQADIQGEAGIQPVDQFAVPMDEVSTATIRELGIQ
jgi:hypothetical protein